MAVAMGFMPAQCLYAASKLRVADALAAGPLPAAQIAAAVGAKPGHLRRWAGRRAVASQSAFTLFAVLRARAGFPTAPLTPTS